MVCSESLEDKIEGFNRLFLDCANKHAPVCYVTPKKLPAPWLNKELKCLMYARDMARRDWRRHRCHSKYLRFKKLRNETQIAVREAKRKFYMTTFGTNSNQTEVWSKLRSLGLIKRKVVDRVLRFSLDELNNSFVSAASMSGDGVDINFDHIIFNDNNFYWRNIEAEDVVAAFKRNRTLATGIDELPVRLLCVAMPHIIPVLLNIFNFSFIHGVFPSLWKLALVVPVPKVSSPSSTRDYRPVFFVKDS